MVPEEEFQTAQMEHRLAVRALKLYRELEQIARKRMIEAAQRNNVFQMEKRDAAVDPCSYLERTYSESLVRRFLRFFKRG
jgi:hypothetical protein